MLAIFWRARSQLYRLISFLNGFPLRFSLRPRPCKLLGIKSGCTLQSHARPQSLHVCHSAIWAYRTACIEGPVIRRQGSAPSFSKRNLYMKNRRKKRDIGWKKESKNEYTETAEAREAQKRRAYSAPNYLTNVWKQRIEEFMKLHVPD